MNKFTRKNNKIFGLFLIVFIISLCCSVFAPSVYANNKAARTIKVGYMLMDNFEEQQVVSQDGEKVIVRSGYGYDYLQMIRNYTGWNYEYVIGSWQELVDKLEKGEIDILSHVAKTPRRNKTMLFSTEPQGRETHYLYVDGPNESIDENDITTLNGKNIGVIDGDFRTVYFKEWCKENNLDCNIIYYKDISEIHTALHSGKIHATSASNLTVSSYKDAKWRAVFRFNDSPVYFAVKTGSEGREILKELNDAHKQILSINENYGEELQQQYSFGYQKENPQLTQREQNYLKQHGTITLGYCDSRRPLAYTNSDGKLSGLLADYISAISEKYNIQFETKAYETGTELLDALVRKEVDVISPVGYNSGLAEAYKVVVTNPLTVETMVAVYKGYKGTQPKDIFEQIAILDNSITEKDYAKRYYPESEWIKAQTVEEALELVDDDKAGCYIIRSSVWAWYKNDYPLLNDLQMITLPNSNNVNMAILEENRELLPILNKGITLLSEADVNQSIVTYSDARAEITIFTLMADNPFVTSVIIFAICLAIGFVLLVFRLRTEGKYLKKLEEANSKAEKARVDAEKANMVKSSFLTSMSHDIRTPMNAIIGMTTLASKHIDNPEYVRNCLGKVTLASDHLLTLINDVLDINKIESGNLSLSPTVFSLADSIMNLANIGRNQIQDKNHQFEIRIHKIKNEYLFADELRINQIFINLLSNAIKYTPENGKIFIDVKQEDIPHDKSKTRLIYIIEDSGIGMSKEFQEQMYDLFAMANRSTRTINGSGVGLSICKQLVDLMDGSILCESDVEKGTKFTVTLELPIADKVVDNFVLPPMKLLLVDDDEIFLTTASETLRDLGLDPDCVDSGEKAIEVVKQKHAEDKDYPLIIIDWQMPDMDGIETTRRIRAHVGEDVSIIVISAYAPEDIRDAAIAAGANGFISKPFFSSNAYRSISEILGIRDDAVVEFTDSQHRLDGMSILVAEDNDLNWEIARELLNMYNISADRAENGQICIDMINNAPANKYDAILMDIQMPVLDGYEATKIIRTSGKEETKNIPIIAMTANAYTEDVLRCAETGMNAHVPKPIDMDRLLELLGNIRNI